ncbi:unnamed protein product, partial [Discosporangium mesarthrocarpum]
MPPRAWNKRFILKTMFLATGMIWREIGIWPIVDVVIAQCGSKRRPRGDPVLRPDTVDGEKYKEIMIDEVIPAVKAETLRPPGHTIFVQQDGAKLHTKKRVMEVTQAETGNSIVLETQPSNSPELNVNDLRFFHSIQQLKQDVGMTTAEGLVKATLEAFDIYPQGTLECVWHSLFAVYGEILGSKGDNNYKISHSGKEQAQRKGGLPKN